MASDWDDWGVITASTRGSDSWPFTGVTCAVDSVETGAMVCSRCAVRFSNCFSCRFVSEISFNMS